MASTRVIAKFQCKEFIKCMYLDLAGHIRVRLRVLTVWFITVLIMFYHRSIKLLHSFWWFTMTCKASLWCILKRWTKCISASQLSSWLPGSNDKDNSTTSKTEPRTNWKLCCGFYLASGSFHDKNANTKVAQREPSIGVLKLSRVIVWMRGGRWRRAILLMTNLKLQLLLNQTDVPYNPTPFSSSCW